MRRNRLRKSGKAQTRRRLRKSSSAPRRFASSGRSRKLPAPARAIQRNQPRRKQRNRRSTTRRARTLPLALRGKAARAHPQAERCRVLLLIRPAPRVHRRRVAHRVPPQASRCRVRRPVVTARPVHPPPLRLNTSRKASKSLAGTEKGGHVCSPFSWGSGHPDAFRRSIAPRRMGKGAALPVKAELSVESDVIEQGKRAASAGFGFHAQFRTELVAQLHNASGAFKSALVAEVQP